METQQTSDAHEPIWIETDIAGSIIDWSDTALPLVGYSARGMKGRPLPLMFIQNRPTSGDLTKVTLGGTLERDGVIRPHDRRGVPVRFSVQVADWSIQDSAVLRWTFNRRD